MNRVASWPPFSHDAVFISVCVHAVEMGFTGIFIVPVYGNTMGLAGSCYLGLMNILCPIF